MGLVIADISMMSCLLPRGLTGGEVKVELTCGAKGISLGELPHARGDMCDSTTAEDDHAYDEIGTFDVPCLDVVQEYHQHCRAEREEAAAGKGLSVNRK